jgi:hypothetical protein
LIAGTWRLSVENMVLALSGRRWLVFSGVTAILGAYYLTFAGSIELSQRRIAAPWDSLIYSAWILAGVKLCLAVGILALLRRRRLITGDTVAWAVRWWLVSATGVFAILGLLVPPGPVASPLLIPCAMLAVPLVRIAAAPLALDWNRHR